jgi:hypothetical protein
VKRRPDEAFEAIKATLPVGSVGYETEFAAGSDYLIGLDERTV